MVTIKCKKCGHDWNYKGGSYFYACCPRCKTSLKIKEGHKLSLENIKEPRLKIKSIK